MLPRPTPDKYMADSDGGIEMEVSAYFAASRRTDATGALYSYKYHNIKNSMEYATKKNIFYLLNLSLLPFDSSSVVGVYGMAAWPHVILISSSCVWLRSTKPSFLHPAILRDLAFILGLRGFPVRTLLIQLLLLLYYQLLPVLTRVRSRAVENARAAQT